MKKWQCVPLDENGCLEFNEYWYEVEVNNPLRFFHYAIGESNKHGFAIRLHSFRNERNDIDFLETKWLIVRPKYQIINTEIKLIDGKGWF